MRANVVIFLSVLCVVSGYVEAEKVTPVQKVIQLLNGMLENAKKEKHEEAVMFASFKQFCDDTTRDTSENIAAGNDSIKKLNADILKFDADAQRLGREIENHQADIARWTRDIANAQTVRDKEHEDYLATHKDYSESVDALGRAVQVMKNQSHDRKQEALLQVAKYIPANKFQELHSFLQMQKGDGDDDFMNREAPEANAYEFQSGKIVALLEKLQDQFEDERSTLEKEEANKKHSFDMFKQDTTGSINDSTSISSDKSQEKAENEENSGSANADLDETTKNRDEDKAYLTELDSTCKTKSVDFENRQQLRGEEIEAISKAVEILSDGKVSGAADKHLPAYVQTSFLQLRSVQNKDMTISSTSKAVAFLKAQSEKLHSRVLSNLVQDVSVDPFTKIKKMIKVLINRLMEEATSESKHKKFCDKELSLNKNTRVKKEGLVSENKATIDELSSDIQELTEECSDLQDEIIALQKQSQEATQQRQDEKAKNEQTIADAKAAQSATSQALEVLKDFYAKAGRATSLVSEDRRNPKIPQVMQKSFKGQQAESGGIVGMLEVIQSDFARLETETETSEAESERVFQEEERERDTLRSDKSRTKKKQRIHKIRKK